MTTTEVRVGWVPTDTFGARLALVRQHMEWNVAEAARACGQSDESWRGWEHGRSPRKIHWVAKDIVDATGCDYEWLMWGGELTTEVPADTQRTLLDWVYVFGGPAQLSLFGGADVAPVDASELDAIVYTLPGRDRRRCSVPVRHDRRHHQPVDLGLTG